MGERERERERERGQVVHHKKLQFGEHKLGVVNFRLYELTRSQTPKRSAFTPNECHTLFGSVQKMLALHKNSPNI
jgi:hypothetical protein